MKIPSQQLKFRFCLLPLSSPFTVKLLLMVSRPFGAQILYVAIFITFFLFVDDGRED